MPDYCYKVLLSTKSNVEDLKPNPPLSPEMKVDDVVRRINSLPYKSVYNDEVNDLNLGD